MPKKDAPMETFRSPVREPATVPEQVDGLQQSDDILRLLPPELATLGITELEFEFYRKLVEKQLLTYRLHGDAWREKITERPVTRQDFDEQPRGPFIVCVDTSGSMGGFNEQCAKAFCLALMRIALADNRRCFIMLFSSEVVHYELTSESGLEQAIRFLSQRFRGGTDLASCFRAIIERLQNPQWVDADAVVISDFIAQRLPDEVIAQVGSYSVSISTVFTRWRCRFTANPASCASSIISGALTPGCVAACCDAGGANRYSSAETLSRTCAGHTPHCT